MSERTTYARYIVPDVIVDNEYAREVPVGGEPVPVSSKPLHLSGRFWIDGEAFDYEQVCRLQGDFRVLRENMIGNGWAKVVRHRHGGFRPFDDGDQIVKTRTVAQ